MGERELANRTRFGDSGYVYFVGALEGSMIKIGWTLDPERRLATLDCGSPVPLVLIGAMPGTQEQEASLHARFRAVRVKGEWFKACPDLVAIAEMAARMWNAPRGIKCKVNGGHLGPV